MDIESKRTLLDESIDSGEFFLGQLRQRIQTLQTKRDTLKSSLAAVESEERTLRIQQNKLEGLLLSQYVFHSIFSYFFVETVNLGKN